MTVRLLTTAEVAEQLQMSRQVVLALARSRKLACIKTSNTNVRFTQEAVDRFVADWQTKIVTKPIEEVN